MESISGVLHQLKNVEKDFTYIIMEAALKLIQLTESKIFIVIESNEGRTFSGSTSLCQTYSTEGLFLGENDTKLELDTAKPGKYLIKTIPGKMFSISANQASMTEPR